MAGTKADRAVHRLLDMVVEEVSLVDRAANQHRFLIVKRSEPMDQDTAAAADAAARAPSRVPSAIAPTRRRRLDGWADAIARVTEAIATRAQV